MTKREIKAAQFTTLMNQVNALYTLDSKVYVNTLEGKTLATVTEINASKYKVSCSVVLDLGNGREKTLMFTASDIVEEVVEEVQPVDAYEGLELSEDMPTSEDINAALGVKNPCSFMQAVEANTAENACCLPVKDRQLTEEEKYFYWHAYHEGHKQGQAELNDIVNP